MLLEIIDGHSQKGFEAQIDESFLLELLLAFVLIEAGALPSYRLGEPCLNWALFYASVRHLKR